MSNTEDILQLEGLGFAGKRVPSSPPGCWKCRNTSPAKAQSGNLHDVLCIFDFPLTLVFILLQKGFVLDLVFLTRRGARGFGQDKVSRDDAG